MRNQVSGLSAASTTDQVKAAYDDSASYDVDRSVAEAQTFIAACRILLRRIPAAARQGDSLSIEMDVKLLRQELRRAVQWLNAINGAGGGQRFSDFSDFRR
ncbi:MAG TPA: hypothetical protein VFX03_03020 [Thermomicrobiales bacterium]|nr:hypothetical protein [Thermomicrobiales bacterium]